MTCSISIIFNPTVVTTHFLQGSRETESAALGSLQKGVVDVMGSVVELVVGEENGAPRWLVRVQSPAMCAPFDMAAPSREVALEVRPSGRPGIRAGLPAEGGHGARNI